jgi:transposase-like protein
VFNATHQRCRMHWMRKALAHAPTKQRMTVAAMLKTIFAQEAKADAKGQGEVVADALRDKQSKLAALMNASRDDVLAYMTFPREHWAPRPPARSRSSASTEKSSKGLTSSASSPTTTPLFVWSGR